MNFSLIWLMALATVAIYQVEGKPGLYLSPYGYKKAASSQESYLSNSEIRDMVTEMKGQMVLMTFKGLLQSMAMRGIAEKIDSMDERLSAVEGKLGLTATESSPAVQRVDKIDSDEIEMLQQKAKSAESTTSAVDSTDDYVRQKSDLLVDYKIPSYSQEPQSAMNDIVNANEKQYHYTYKE